MVEIRGFRSEDLDDLYRIALATAARGSDASAVYRDPALVGHVFAAPYALFSPETVFVIEDEHGIGGYIVGAANTPEFDARLEAEWWPKLRSIYADPAGLPRASWGRDEVVSRLIHAPFHAPRQLTLGFPAHLHINLLPRLRGRGHGSRLMDRWLRAVHLQGARGAHLSVGSANRQAIRFYRRCGFRALTFSTPVFADALWFGINLEGFASVNPEPA